MKKRLIATFTALLCTFIFIFTCGDWDTIQCIMEKIVKED